MSSPLCYYSVTMIRSNVRHHEPVYRDVLKHAVLSAWRDKRFWPLAFLASILLTGSSYDILFTSVEAVTRSSATVGTSFMPALRDSALLFKGNLLTFFNVAYALQAIIAMAALLIAFLAVSCVAQAGLVYALGATRRGNLPTLQEAFRIGGGAFWPVAAINALALAVVWILRFLVAFPLYLAISQPSSLTWLLYLASFIIFIPLTFVVLVIQVFSLNAMILQGAPAAEAILRSYIIFKKHWVTIVETAVLLFFMTIGFGMLATGLLFVGMIPLLVGIMVAAFIHSPALFALVLGLGLVILILAAFAAAAFLTQLHYATWTFLYRRLGEGGVFPKIHRWVRALTNTFTVPQS